MRKIFYTIIFLFTISSIFGQGINSKALEFTNKVTDKHVCLPGTNLQMILPPDFICTKPLLYEQPSTQSRIAIQEFDSDINKNIYAFSKGNLLQVGIIVRKETFFLINGYESIIIEGQQFIDSVQYAAAMMLIGDQQKTYMVIAITPVPIQNNLAREFTASLLSTIYSPEKYCPSDDNYVYTIDTESFGLKETQKLGNTRLFTDDGNIPSHTEDRISLTIKEHGLSGEISEEEKKELCRRLFAAYPLKDEGIEISEPTLFEGNGFTGYEIFASGKTSYADKEFIYLLVIVKNDRYIVLTGMSLGDKQESLTLFRNVAKSIKF